MLSVVIPSYNHERYIGEAVDSVRDQTLPPSELLVVDDGSTDGTLDVMIDHAFPAMRVLPQENRGAHAAINRAIELTRGEYIAILNSDDVFEPERLEHAWTTARTTGAALVFGSVRLIDADGAVLPSDHEAVRWYERVQAHAANARPPAETLLVGNLAMTTSNFFVHRELWRRLGGFRPYRYVHDYDFLLRAVALCPGRVRYHEELCDVRYRLHGRNTITEDVDRASAERRAMMREHTGVAGRLAARLTRPVRARGLRNVIGRTPLPDPVAARPRARRREDALRVGLVASSLDRGGLEEVVALLAQALPAEGIEVRVLCTHGGGAVADRLLASGVSVRAGEGKPEAWRGWQRDFSPHVLSTHHVGLEAVEALSAAAPVVDTVHNTYAWLSEREWLEELEKRRLTSATIAVSELVARYHTARLEATELAAAAAGTGEEAERRRGRPERGPTAWRVVPNAVHPGRAARVPKALARRLLGLAPDDVIFTHVGRLASQKNLETLVAAFAELARIRTGVRLVLAGPAEGERAARRLRSRAPDLFRSGVVRHLPSVEPVGALLSAADAFVSSSFYEGWSLAASEALWVGIPLVLTDCGGARELVGEDGDRGHLVPNPLGDPMAASPELLAKPPEAAMATTRGALVEALGRVLDERMAWSMRSAEIRAHARRALAPERLAAGYAAVLREAACVRAL